MAFFLRKKEKKNCGYFSFPFFFGLVNDIVNHEGNRNSIKRRKAIYIYHRENVMMG